MAIPRTSLPNLRINSGLLQKLASPSFSARAGEAIGQAMLGPENRREEREKMARMDALMDASTRGVAAAQMGDVRALSAQMDAIKEQFKNTTSSEERLALLPELRALQGLMPGAKATQQSRSVDSLFRIDAELGNVEAMRKKIDDSYVANGRDPISDGDFKRITDTLATQRSRILEDPNVSESYEARKAANLSTRLETERMESVAWIAQNGDAIKQAIKSGDREELNTALQNVPRQYQAQVDSFVSSQIEAEGQLQDFRSDSILKTQEPINTDFSSSIKGLADAGIKTRELERLNKQYMDLLESHWLGSNWDDLANKDRAAKLEQRIIQTIERQSDTIALNTWQRQQDDIARDKAIIEEAQESISNYRPGRLDVNNRAEELAAIAGELGAGEKLSDLPGEDRARYSDDARAELIDENTNIMARRILDIDASEVPRELMRTLTVKQAERLGTFRDEERQIIMEEYAAERGLTDIDEIIDDLLEFEDIQEPVPASDEEKTPAPTRTIRSKSGRTSRPLETPRAVQALRGDLPSRASSRAGRP